MRIGLALVLLAALAVVISAGVLYQLNRSRPAPPAAPAWVPPPAVWVAPQREPRVDLREPKVRRPVRALYAAEQFETLVVGKTQDEVLKLLGEPHRKDPGDRWAYAGITTNSELTILQFQHHEEGATVDSVVYQLATRP